MAKAYRPVRRDQPFLLPPDMRDWLPEDHPVWLVIRVVEVHLGTSAFHAARKTGGAGTAGYDPDMLVAVLVWAYAHRVTSSRRIEALCGTDVAFRVICGGNLPDHATIARFRAAFPGTIAEFFAEVLRLCARLGMGRLGTVALDGMKIAASASKAADRTEVGLRKLAGEAVAAHAATDAAEDDLFGDARGDEVPGDAWHPRRRDERIAAALSSLRAERRAAEAEQQAKAAEYRDAAAAGTPKRGNSPAGAAVELAAMKLARLEDAQRAKAAAWQARRAAGDQAGIRRGPGGGRPLPPEAHAGVARARAALAKARARAARRQRAAAGKDNDRPAPVRNITDPDSRLMPVRGGGFLQGYNTQNVTSEDKLIIATELTDDTTDTGWFEPMLRQAQHAAALLAAHRPPDRHDPAEDDGIGLFLTDAGYCSEHNLTIDGPDRIIATGKQRDLEKATRGGGQASRQRAGPATRAMAARLTTPGGITAYRQRGHIAETPHGHIKHNMGIRQLSMRGKPKAAAEWKFTCAVHNLFKAITTGHLTPAALDNLAGQAGSPPGPQPA